MGKTISACKSACLFLLCISATAVFPAAVARARTERFSRLDSYISGAIEDWGIPGLAIAIVEDDQVVHTKGFGYRTIHTQDRVDGHTLFAIASNTKAFTATALGVLVQEGKISWDDPVWNVLPDFQLSDPVVTRKMCIRDLLCHRSGLGLWAGDLTWWNSIYDRKEVIRRIRFQKLVSDFRTSYHYTNLMFLVAGEIIPQITGISWDQFIKQRFFDELDMNRSTTSVKDLVDLENVATPHAMLDGDLAAIDYLDVDNCAPAAAINSSVNDLSHWVRLQLNNGVYGGKRLVDSKIILETRKPHTLMNIGEKSRSLNPSIHFSTYGLGFRTHDYQGRLVVNHTGGLDGMVSYVGFMPEENIGVIVLTNMDEHRLHRALPLYVFDVLLGLDGKDWSTIYLDDFKKTQKHREEEEKKRLANKAENTKPTLPVERYAGTYTSDVYGTADIFQEEGQLRIGLSAHPKFEATMTHWHYDTFLATWNHRLWGESYVYFRLNGHGKITKFLMSVRPDWIDTLEYSFVKND